MGLDEALRRGERHFRAGTDALFIEAPRDEAEWERIASAFRGRPLVADMLKGGGMTTPTPPTNLHAMGFSMALYLTSLILVGIKAPQGALRDVKAGCHPVEEKGVDFAEYERVVGLSRFASPAHPSDRFRRKIGVSPSAPRRAAQRRAGP